MQRFDPRGRERIARELPRRDPGAALREQLRLELGGADPVMRESRAPARRRARTRRRAVPPPLRAPPRRPPRRRRRPRSAGGARPRSGARRAGAGSRRGSSRRRADRARRAARARDRAAPPSRSPTGRSPRSSAASACSIRASISAAAASVNVIATMPRSTRSAIRAGSASGSRPQARSQPGPETPREHARDEDRGLARARAGLDRDRARELGLRQAAAVRVGGAPRLEQRVAHVSDPGSRQTASAARSSSEPPALRLGPRGRAASARRCRRAGTRGAARSSRHADVSSSRSGRRRRGMNAPASRAASNAATLASNAARPGSIALGIDHALGVFELGIEIDITRARAVLCVGVRLDQLALRQATCGVLAGSSPCPSSNRCGAARRPDSSTRSAL